MDIHCPPNSLYFREDKNDNVDNKNPNYYNNSNSNHLCCVFFGGDKEISRVCVFIHIRVYIFIQSACDLGR